MPAGGQTLKTMQWILGGLSRGELAANQTCHKRSCKLPTHIKVFGVVSNFARKTDFWRQGRVKTFGRRLLARWVWVMMAMRWAWVLMTMLRWVWVLMMMTMRWVWVMMMKTMRWVWTDLESC